MQKPKNILPGLFLCVFSRIAEPLVDFYCSNFWIFLFLFGADFFCRKERCFRPILYRPILYRPILRADSTKNPTAPHERAQRKKPREPVAPLNAHLEIPTQKARRAHHTFTARLYLACRRAPRKAPASARPQPLKNYPFGALYRKPCLVYAHKRPHAKNPGSKSRGLVDEKSINLLLTHCGRFLAGCTGPACSRRPQ